jgi:hypothetical protein
MRKLQQPISLEKITCTIQKCAKENIKKKTKEEAPKRKLKWRTTEIITLIREKRKAERTYKRTPSTENLIANKNLKAQTRRTMREERRNQWNQFIESNTAKTSSHHEVWEKIRKIFGKRKLHQIKRLIKSNGQSTTSPLEKANKLANQFSKTSFNANYPSNFRKKKENKHRLKQQRTFHSPKKNSTRHFQNAKDHHQDQTTSTMSS